MPSPSTIPCPPPAFHQHFTVAAHRAFNDALEARQRRPEEEIRRARACLDAALDMLAAAAAPRRGRR